MAWINEQAKPIGRALKRLQRRAERNRCPKTQKLGYRTKAKALKAAGWSAENSGAPIYVYSCPFCPCFHLTHQPRRNKARDAGE